MSKFNYHAYLASREWAILKRVIETRAYGCCERCRKQAKRRQLHHLTYAHVGQEYLNELISLCGSCHEYLSGKSNFDPVDDTQWQEVRNWALKDWASYLRGRFVFSALQFHQMGLLGDDEIDMVFYILNVGHPDPIPDYDVNEAIRRWENRGSHPVS